MTFLAILALAVLVEGIIEYLGQRIPTDYKPPVAAFLSVVVCLLYGADLLATFGIAAKYPYAGEIMTGLIIGRGSNYLNDIWSRIKVVSLPAASVGALETRPIGPADAVVME